MGDDFEFDFGDDEFDIDTGEDTTYNIEDDNEYGFNNLENKADQYDFSNTEEEQTEALGINTKKYMIIAVIVAIVLLISAIMIWKIAKGTSEKEENNTVQNDIQDSVESNIQQEITVNSNKDWVAIDNQQDINYTGKTQALFTVTNIEHQARMNGSSLEVRTELTGNISGYTGIYTLYIDYSDGINLAIGDTIDVELSVGNYGDNSIIGIIYIK